MTVFVPSGLTRRDAGTSAREAADRTIALRQRAVDHLGVVDSPREERFDRLMRMACQAFDMPLASLGFADRDRLWLKAAEGEERSSLPLHETMCSHTIADGARTVVPDTAGDRRFEDIPSVADGSVRFYAGYPLTDPNGITIGAFCVADSRPRELTEAQLALLAELADWAQHELTAATENARAHEVQQLLLPLVDPVVPGYDIAAVCVPSLGVGGDFYDWEQLDDAVGFVVADVMGKGTPAAIMSATVRSSIRAGLRRDLDRRTPGDTDPRVHEMVRYAAGVLDRDLERTGMLVTAFCGMVDPLSHTLSWVDVGHGLALVAHADGTTTWLESHDLPLGVDRSASWTQHTYAIRPGDTLAVFSDGLLDLSGGGAQAMSDIAQLVRSVPDPAELMRQVVFLSGLGVAGDDITMLALHRHE